MRALYIAPYGSIEEEIMQSLEIPLWQIFGYEVKRMTNVPDPSFALDDRTKQYSSSLILKDLIHRVPHDAVRVLGVTNCDLFIPMLSFVFGHAQVNGPAAVISLARLHQKFYHLPENRNLFRRRLLKEAVHELGHTFGLIHCSDSVCAMSLSNSIQQVDKKTEELCSTCLIQYEENTNHLRRENGMEVRQ